MPQSVCQWCFRQMQFHVILGYTINSYICSKQLWRGCGLWPAAEEGWHDELPGWCWGPTSQQYMTECFWFFSFSQYCVLLYTKRLEWLFDQPGACCRDAADYHEEVRSADQSWMCVCVCVSAKICWPKPKHAHTRISRLKKWSNNIFWFQASSLNSKMIQDVGFTHCYS